MRKTKKKIYSRQILGEFTIGSIEYHFEFSISKPFDSLEEAKADKSVARFEIYDGHVIVFVYSGWSQDAADSDAWFECTTGDVVDIIEWDQWWKYRLTKSRPDVQYKDSLDPQYDYIPCTENWDELFGAESLSPDWGLNVNCYADFITRCL